MAYNAAITSYRQADGCLCYEVTETEAAAGSEFTLEGLPAYSTLMSYEGLVGAGSGSTINPRLGWVDSFVDNTLDHLATSTFTAGHINDQTRLFVPARDTRKLVVNSNIDTGNDNTITHRFVFAQGAI